MPLWGEKLKEHAEIVDFRKRYIAIIHTDYQEILIDGCIEF